MNIIQEKWKESKIVISSGITFANEELFLFDIAHLKLNEQYYYIEKIKLAEYLIDWCDVFIQEELNIPNSENKIVVGSGGLGADGFIALVSNSNELIWSIFSENTNGFINIEYENNIASVESGSGYNYAIPINEPLKLKRLENKSPFHNNGERTTYPPYSMP